MAFNQDTQDMIDNRPDMWDDMYNEFYDIFNKGEIDYRFNAKFYKWLITDFIKKVKPLDFQEFVKDIFYTNYSVSIDEFKFFIDECLKVKSNTRHSYFSQALKDIVIRRKYYFDNPEITSLIIIHSLYFTHQTSNALVYLRDSINSGGILLEEFKQLSEKAQTIFLDWVLSEEQEQYIHYIDGDILINELPEHILIGMSTNSGFFRKISESATKELMFKIFDAHEPKDVNLYRWAENNPKASLTDAEIDKYSGYFNFVDATYVNLLSKEQIQRYNVDPYKLLETTKMITDDIIEYSKDQVKTEEELRRLGKKLINFRFITDETINKYPEYFDPKTIERYAVYISLGTWKKLNKTHNRRTKYIDSLRTGFNDIFDDSLNMPSFGLPEFEYLAKNTDFDNKTFMDKAAFMDTRYISNKTLKAAIETLQKLYK